MSTGGKIKKPCSVYWDIGDASVVGATIKETVYLVRSVCESNDLDDVSFQCISSVNSISNYVGDCDTIKLITVSDYTKSNACAKIVQLIEQFLYEYESGSPIILIDPNNLFSTPLSNLSARFDFEIYFIHLERTFEPSLEPVADNHFYLEGSSIYPLRPLAPSEIGTVAVQKYPPTVDTFNLIREIDHLYKSYGRIENSTICNSEHAVVWVFFPSQQLAQSAANETQGITFRGSALSIVYLPQPPCPINDHPILALLVSFIHSPAKLCAHVPVDNSLNPSTDQLPSIDTNPPTLDPQLLQLDSEPSESSNQSISHEQIEPDQCSVAAAETLSQLSSGNTTLNITQENISSSHNADEPSISSNTVNEPTLNALASSASPTPVICFMPKDGTTSSPNASVQEPTQSNQQPPSPIQKPSNHNSTMNSDPTSEPAGSRKQPDKNLTSCVSPKIDCPFSVVAVSGRPNGVDERKFYCDIHGLFKKAGRLEDATIIYEDSVLLGFPDDQTAKRVAHERNGMIYFGVVLTVTYIEKPTSNIISLMKNEPVPCSSKLNKSTVLQDPDLVVTMKSLKRSAPKSSIYVDCVTDIGAINITNTPKTMEIRSLLSNLNGHFKRLGSITDSAIWFKGTVWICFPHKTLARSVAAENHGMNFHGTKLTINFIENPPNLLVRTHFMSLLTPVADEKTIFKRFKRARRSTNQHSSLKGSATSGSINFIPNPCASVQSLLSPIKSDDSKDRSEKSKGSKNKSNQGSSVPTSKQASSGSQKNSCRSKSPEGITELRVSIPVQNIRSTTSDNLQCSKFQVGTRSNNSGTMETEKSHGDVEIHSNSSNDNNERVEANDETEGIAYARRGGKVEVEPEVLDRNPSSTNESLDSYDSLSNYAFSESIIFPMDGLAADSRFDYYQSNVYQAHKFSDLIKATLYPDRFVILENIDFKAYPNKFWVFYHLLRLTWPYGVLKIAHTRNDVYILFASCEGASSAVKLFNKERDVSLTPCKGSSDDLFPPLEEMKASVPEQVPSSVLKIIAMYAGTYSPWCFTENWDLFFLSIQVRNFIEAQEFAFSKGVVSNFGSLFIKPKDSQMIVAYANEKRVIHTMLFMKQSFVAKYDFCVNPHRPPDLLTLIRDYDLTGCCARLSQIALQQTFKLIHFRAPPPLIIVQRSNNISRDLNNTHVEINFNDSTARTCETSPPIRGQANDSNDSAQCDALMAINVPFASSFEAQVNYYLKIEYNAHHVWCYMYDLLSKLWYYRIVKLTYRQEHQSRSAETWIEVLPHVNKDDLIRRLSAINYLKAPKIHTITSPPFDILNNTISTGSSPWFFNDALKLKFATIVPTGQTTGADQITIDVRTIKHLVEDEHAVFVKLKVNVIWIAFPDMHTLLQGLLLLNHEQRIRTGLMAYSQPNIPDDLLSTIEIDDLVGVARDLAIANSLEPNN